MGINIHGIPIQGDKYSPEVREQIDAAVSEWNKVRNMTGSELKRYTYLQEKLAPYSDEIKMLDAKLAKKGISDKEVNSLKAERDELVKKREERLAAVEYVISDDAKTVTFYPKKDIPVEEFKKLFGIKDGAFRNVLKAQIQAEADAGETNFSNGVYIEAFPVLFGFAHGRRFNYESAILFTGDNDNGEPYRYTINIDDLK